VEIDERPFGGAAIDEPARLFPTRRSPPVAAPLRCCSGRSAAPRWTGGPPPEQGLIDLRKELGVYANLRSGGRQRRRPDDRRELTGGLYYGARGTRKDGTVFDTLEYHPSEVARIARSAFQIARARTGHLLSVDKANVLETSRMWRRGRDRGRHRVPRRRAEPRLVDSVAMQLVTNGGRSTCCDGEHVRRHPLRRRGRGTGGLGLAPPRASATAAPGSSSRCTARTGDRGTGAANPAAMLRSLALAPSTGSARRRSRGVRGGGRRGSGLGADR